AVSAASTAAAAISTNSPGGATPGPQSGSTLSSAKCQAIGDAYLDFSGEYLLMGLASDEAYAANTPDSPTYINIPKIRTDLDVLATLPGGTVGELGGALDQFRQLVDQVDSNFKSGGKPFSDGSNNGQKAMDLYLKLSVPFTVVAEDFGNSCPNYAASTPAPAVAGFQIGETAPVGDLRVTLDSVAEAPLEAGVIPAVGNRFLLVHVTIVNSGQVALQISGLTQGSLQDAAGNIYGYDPFANTLAAAGGESGLDGEIEAGATRSGMLGYQLPVNAGDLLWTFRDYAQNEAVFAAKEADIDTSGAAGSSTQDAARSDADATMTELFSIIATSDAMALTATPAP
ncbi:MAG: DUF4352 domain-containing protein, partial [Anaerolineales bacterium]